MKYIVSWALALSALAACKHEEQKDIEYYVYSSILKEKFGHLNNPSIIGINDTLKDFRNELGTLIYSVQHNEMFFKDYCSGDSSFKNFILDIRTMSTRKEIMDLEKLKSKTNFIINFEKLIKPETPHQTIWFSKVVFNDTKDKAITFIAKDYSGFWIFVELNNNRWEVQHEITSYTI